MILPKRHYKAVSGNVYECSMATIDKKNHSSMIYDDQGKKQRMERSVLREWLNDHHLTDKYKQYLK